MRNNSRNFHHQDYNTLILLRVSLIVFLNLHSIVHTFYNMQYAY